MREQRVIKLYNKIIQIVIKGSSSMIDYYNFIDETINNGLYAILQDVFIIYFNTDIRLYNSITILKEKSFKVAQSNCPSSFEAKLKSYYDANNVYQVGQNIYDNSNNELLGRFEQKEVLTQYSFRGVTYSYVTEQIYYRNRYLYHKFDEIKDQELHVIGNSECSNNLTVLNDPTMELLDKYKLGVTILIGGNASVNNYLDNDYIDCYFL